MELILLKLEAPPRAARAIIPPVDPDCIDHLLFPPRSLRVRGRFEVVGHSHESFAEWEPAPRPISFAETPATRTGPRATQTGVRRVGKIRPRFLRALDG